MNSMKAVILVLVSQLMLHIAAETSVSDQTTMKSCPTIPCESPCVLSRGSDGCYSLCECPKTCDDKKCGKHEVCRLVVVQCIRAPCFSIPTCFSKIDSCTRSPNMFRCAGFNETGTRWTYNSTANACQTFRFRGCTPSPNTFDSEDQCMAKCSRRRSRRRVIDCLDMPCAPDCVGVYQGPFACPKCDCSSRNPCQAVKCDEGEECRLRQVQCITEPCDPQPYCAPK